MVNLLPANYCAKLYPKKPLASGTSLLKGINFSPQIINYPFIPRSHYDLIT